MDLVRQVTHLLRERGETRPAPLLGGVAVETRADDGVNVYWRAPGSLVFPFLRPRSLRRYERILGGLGMRTVLHLETPEPYVATWLASAPRARTGGGLPASLPSAPTSEPAPATAPVTEARSHALSH